MPDGPSNREKWDRLIASGVVRDLSPSAPTDELQEVEASEPPRPTAWTIACPWCNAALDYEPEEDDAGQFTPREHWPVCEPCGVVVKPPTVAVTKAAGGPYWQPR